MKKWLFLFPVIFLVSCFGPETINQTSQSEVFDIQKTYFLRQAVVDLIPYYNVWKTLPVKPMDYPDVKSLMNDKFFMGRKRFNLTSDDFVLNDKRTGKKYVLEEDQSSDTDRDMKHYIFKENNTETVLARIDQLDRLDMFTYEITIDDKKVNLIGQAITSTVSRNNIRAFQFSIGREKVTYGQIVKEFKYSQNEYKIMINREYQVISDPLFISIGIFIDQILKEKSFRYKSQ